MMCVCTNIEHPSELNVLKRWFMPYVLIKHVTAVEFKACAMCFFDILLLSCVLFLISARGTECDHYKYILTLLLYNISPSSSLSPSSLVAPLATYKKINIFTCIPPSSYQTYSSRLTWNLKCKFVHLWNWELWCMIARTRISWCVVHDTICNNISAEKVIDYVDMIKNRS